MKTYRLAQFVIVFGISLLPARAGAGLNLSDGPMFVTEVLLPNVVISPVYYWALGESLLKDIPWSDSAQLPTLTSPPWSYSALSAKPLAFRVTPWPRSVVSTTSSANGCVSATDVGSYVCSQTSLYGGGDVTANGNNATNNAIGYSITNGRYKNLLTGNKNQPYYGQEMYPQRLEDIYGDIRYDDAKSRYFHSDSNFLYFNLAAASGYGAWPSLGGTAFPSYDNVDSAKNALYSPMTAYSGAGSVALDEFIDNPMMSYSTNRNTASTPLAHKAYLGQYWVKNGTQVIDKASFVGTCWNLNDETRKFGCTEEMDGSQKIQFAHWFTYWRSADYATRGMLGKLFDGLNSRGVLDKFRFAISRREGSAGSSVDGFYSVANSTGASKAERSASLLATIRNIIYSSQSNFAQSWEARGTNYRLNRDDAYQDGSGQPIRSCRRNYEIIITPDYSGLSWANLGLYMSPRDTDVELPDQVSYTDTSGVARSVPYPDRRNQQSTWSQVGAEGWVTDLRTDLRDTLLPGVQDPATWQHVVRYIVGPNAEGGDVFPKGAIDPVTAATLAGNATRNNQWPTLPPSTRVDFRPTYDDLWHLALNSHGYFYPSNNVSDAVANLLNAFSDVLVRNVAGSAAATNTASLEQGGEIYLATVESNWKGHMRAYDINRTINSANKTILSVDYGTIRWDLAEQVSSPPHSERKIATYSGLAGVPFRWDRIGNAAQSLLKTSVPTGITDADAYGGKLLEYLRGSGECEEGAGSTCNSGVPYAFRRRNLDSTRLDAYSASNPNGRNVLGDIANSNPWYVPPPVAGRSDVDYPGYNAFRIASKSRPNVIYVGANDGMLHAVKASDGTELFAYVPSFVNANLYQLASPSYGHKFYVDGSPFSADVDIGSTSNNWKTVLAGGVNKGGMGYYLLDVTDPANNTEANAASSDSSHAGWVLWEFTHPDLYYTYNMAAADHRGQARQIVRVHDATLDNGKWAMIVGNGYPSNSDKQACLFVVYLSGPSGDSGTWVEGTDYRKLCAGNANYTSSGGLDTNGLSTPTPYDIDGDGKVDVVYAGDLNGNLWKFDLSASNNVNWSVGSPVFVAKSAAGVRQPIISPPEVFPHIVGTRIGQLVLFGTGKYIEDTDRSNTDSQSFYGVWDRGLSGITRSNLYGQTFTVETTSLQQIRKQSVKTIPTYCTAETLVDCPNDTVTMPAPGTNAHLGWYWDMPEAGERLTGKMNLINGVIAFNTFYPATETYTEGGVTKTRLDPCQYGGDGWVMGLNAVNGYMEDQFSVFDVNRDGVVDSSDVRAAGVKIGAAIGGTSFARGIGGTRIGIFAPTALGTHSSEGSKTNIVINTGTAGSGRVSWFELLE